MAGQCVQTPNIPTLEKHICYKRTSIRKERKTARIIDTRKQFPLFFGVSYRLVKNMVRISMSADQPHLVHDGRAQIIPEYIKIAFNKT